MDGNKVGKGRVRRDRAALRLPKAAGPAANSPDRTDQMLIWIMLG
jgi:hypothetical protein